MSPLELSATIVAVVLAGARLLNAARWAWAWLPTWLQVTVPALVYSSAQVAETLRGTNTWTELAERSLIAVGLVLAATRGRPDVIVGRPMSSRPPAPPALCLALALLGVGLPSCGLLSAARPVLAQAAVLAADAANVLNAVESIAREQFRQFPFPEAEREVMASIQDCRVALGAASAALSGAEDLDDGDVDAAFAKFQEAYLRLESVLARHRIQPPAGGRYGAAAGGAGAMPRPLALTRRR